jgi:hypothetical protein
LLSSVSSKIISTILYYYICYEGADLNASIKKLNTYAEKAVEFEKKKGMNSVLSTDDFKSGQAELEVKRQEAERAKKNLKKKIRTDFLSLHSR